ncbi:MAG: N-acetylglucosamine-6-phosphate deacetylase [Rhodospirillales bacterium]
MTVITGLNPESGAGMKITLDGGRIASVEPGPKTEGFISPGLVDLQVNGYCGHDLNNGALEAATVSALARRLLATGVTRFLPTLITAPEAALTGALEAVDYACRTDSVVAAMTPGVHLEGPFISPDDGPRGAHPREHVRPPDLEEVRRWQKASGGRVMMVTLSPHWEGSAEFISALVDMGICAAIGHTHAEAADIKAAVDAGARLSTHLGNGTSASLPRHPNLIWAQLDEDRLTATLIADTHHLPADTLRVFVRAKGLDRIVLISDITAVGGLAPGRYESAIGGAVILDDGGRVGVEGASHLAGAGRTLAEDVSTVMEMTGLRLHQTLQLATANPARFAGGGGVLAAGERADLIRFTPKNGRLDVHDVWLAGERVAPCV